MFTTTKCKLIFLKKDKFLMFSEIMIKNKDQYTLDQKKLSIIYVKKN